MHFIIFFTEKELLTPPLDGTILPSITRRSLLEIAREWNEFNVVEKPITMNELMLLKRRKKVSGRASLRQYLYTTYFRTVNLIHRILTQIASKHFPL